MDRKVVHKVEPGMNPADIACTTYQMRNFYREIGDGFFSGLDVMNLIQHLKAVEMMQSGDVVLDVCCGRGLLLPMIRWYRPTIREYIGVDISAENMSGMEKWSGAHKIEGLNYYPFKITRHQGNVAHMSSLVVKQVDFIVYTSAIEHMQKEDGASSLRECYKLLKPGKSMLISCPNTMDKRDPYDCQYAAHLYEWNLNELKQELYRTGFKVENCFGVYCKKRKLDKLMGDNAQYKKYAEYLPTKFLCPFMAILHPEIADEVLLIVSKPI